MCVSDKQADHTALTMTVYFVGIRRHLSQEGATLME